MKKVLLAVLAVAVIAVPMAAQLPTSPSLGVTQEQILKASKCGAPGVQCAKPMAAEDVRPEYPVCARGSGIVARLTVKIRIGINGVPTNVDVSGFKILTPATTPSLCASDAMAFSQAATIAAMKFRLEPGSAVTGGKAVEVFLQRVVTFAPKDASCALPQPSPSFVKL